MAGAFRIGPYEAIFRIGTGGMATVFAARLKREAGFQKLVAVKRIHASLAQDDLFSRMFLEEARVGAQLTGIHVVQTLDLGRDEALIPYVVQELVVGIDLARLLWAARKQGISLPVGVSVAILTQAAHGLHDAHEAVSTDGRALGLVHRDVSPQNLLVGADGRVRVTDFGIARVATERLVQTDTGVIKGKLSYLSPEQALAGKVDRRSDVFSLGIVAWELFANAALFYGSSPADILDAVKERPVPYLTEVRPDVPREVADTVALALERSLDRRLPTARAFADRLEAAAGKVSPLPTERAVAEFVERVSPPQLDELRDRMRMLARDPTIVTLPDLEIGDEIEATTEVRPPDALSAMTVHDSETTAERRESFTEDGTTMPAVSSIADTDWSPRPIPRSWITIMAIALGVTGVALGIAALVLLLAK